MLGNYKIRVNNESKSKEAQELFEQIGFLRYGISGRCGENWIHFYKKGTEPLRYSESYELTIPQLRDMVVLHRNDVNDATHEFASGSKAYVSSNGVCYEYSDSNWVMFTTGSNGVAMKPIKAETEQGLISGADAKLAWAKGEDVEFHYADTIWAEIPSCAQLSIFDDEEIKFRLKTRTITLNVEIPEIISHHAIGNTMIVNFNNHDDAVKAMEILQGAICKK